MLAPGTKGKANGTEPFVPVIPAWAPPPEIPVPVGMAPAAAPDTPPTSVVT